ncbi:hypothetical protein SOVF_172330 isoform B [Spinacia oleracea]|nr:hypothetical protein SOVF_172330 isoform B [Spinacia oleracea]
MLSVGLNTQLPSITLLKFRQATSGVSICIWYFTAANQVRKCMFLGQIISPDKGIKLKTVVCGWPVGNLAYDCTLNILTGRTHQGKLKICSRYCSTQFQLVTKAPVARNE